MENHVKNPVGSLTIPGRNGGRLRNGGTNKGGTGRPKDEFLAWCREVADDPAIRQRIIETLKTEPIFPESLWARISDRGYGKPTEEISVTKRLLIVDDLEDEI